MLVRSGIILVKYWFSVSDDEQERRFQSRIDDPTKRWKLSPMDLQSRARWVDYSTSQGRDVRPHRHQAGALVRRQRRRQEARPAQLIRHLLSLIPYEDLTPGPDRAAAAPARRRATSGPPMTDQTFVPEVY